jgi:hypothetical protein
MTDGLAGSVAKFLANLVVEKVLPRAAIALFGAVV